MTRRLAPVPPCPRMTAWRPYGITAEQYVCRSLRAVLAGLPAGAAVPHSERLGECLSCLEYFRLEVLRAVHPEWEQEGLDGVLTASIRKSGEGEGELFGLPILISDQSLTPVLLRLQGATAGDEVTWLDCRLGERRGDRLHQTPYPSLNRAMEQLYLLEGQADRVDWCYTVRFGRRRP